MSRWARTLTTTAPNPKLDLTDGVGQRRSTYRFDYLNIVTGYRQQIYPRRDTVPVLTHDTTRTIKRSITGLMFDRETTAELNIVSARLEPYMVLDGVAWPLGQYVFNDQTRARFTSGTISNNAAYDNGFIVDQPITSGFPALGAWGLSAQPVTNLVDALLLGLPVTYTMEPSPFASAGSWMAGTQRGYMLGQLAIDGDYFAPWFDNTNVMRFIRSFDPANAVVTFDFDSGNKVKREPVPIENDDLLTAPNQIVVVGNGSSTVTTTPVYGIYNFPATAPQSAANRGFVNPVVISRQVETSVQAAAIAANLGQRLTLFERIELTTAPDPRHDSYDVIRWQGENWLEIGWSLPLIEGADMRHTARKAYT